MANSVLLNGHQSINIKDVVAVVNSEADDLPSEFLSAHTYTCKCTACWQWWADNGPADDGFFGPFGIKLSPVSNALEKPWIVVYRRIDE